MAAEPNESSTGREGARSRRPLAGVRQVRAPGSPRTVKHVVKVSEEQERRLLERAAERNITVARLMVESSLTGGADAAKAKAMLAGELFRLTRSIGKVGVNINQIARATNATFQAQPETAAAIAAHGRVLARLEQLLDDMDRPAPTAGDEAVS